MAQKRMTPEDRKEQIMHAAIIVAMTKGYSKMNRLMIVHQLNGEVTDGLVSRYFGRRTELRAAVLKEAIARENLTILAQGLALGDPVARKAPKALRDKAAEAVASWRKFLAA